ncbi:MAG: hypothetical protein WBP18_03910 [Paracoccaceae bacterium]
MTLRPKPWPCGWGWIFRMKPFHRVGSLLFLSGHLAQIGERITHRGRLGDTLSIAEGAAPRSPRIFFDS